MDTKDKIKVFLVDDDKLFVNALKHSLSQENADIEIKTFPTGEECVQNLHINPTLVILDYNLNTNYPDAMDGIQVLKKIMRKAPNTAVIILSSQDNIETAMDTLKGGAYDYVPKGEKGFIKIKNIIRRITDEITYLENEEKEASRARKMSLSVMLILLIIFLLSRILL